MDAFLFFMFIIYLRLTHILTVLCNKGAHYLTAPPDGDASHATLMCGVRYTTHDGSKRSVDRTLYMSHDQVGPIE